MVKLGRGNEILGSPVHGVHLPCSLTRVFYYFPAYFNESEYMKEGEVRAPTLIYDGL